MVVNDVIDVHYHLSLTRTMSRLENVQEALDTLEACALEKICIQNIVLWFPRNLTRNPLALLTKLKKPDQVFSFGGVRFPAPNALDKRFNYRLQIEQLMNLGFDGVKLFGKPNIRQLFGERFDSEIFDEMYTYLEQTQFPVLFHVGDPREFWDEKIAPPFARDNGWIYSKPDFDAYYEEIDGIMHKHPNLRLLLPHFYFLSDDISRLRDILNRWPSIWIDITPGSEMYHNFTLNPEEAKRFFIDFQDRILFGTDNVGSAKGAVNDCIAESRERVHCMCDFLDTSHAYGWNEDFLGLSLDPSISSKIKHENFYRYVQAKTPHRVDYSVAAAYAKEIQEVARQYQIPELDEEFEKIIEAYRTL